MRCSGVNPVGAGFLGSGRAQGPSDAARRQFGETPQVLCRGGQEELLPCPGQPAQLEPAQPEMLLEVSEQHLDLAALPGHGGEHRRRCQLAGAVACCFVEQADNGPDPAAGAGPADPTAGAVARVRAISVDAAAMVGTLIGQSASRGLARPT